MDSTRIDIFRDLITDKVTGEVNKTIFENLLDQYYDQYVDVCKAIENSTEPIESVSCYIERGDIHFTYKYKE